MEFVKTTRILKAGRPGTKRLTRIYGKDLVCVRYKNDYKNKSKYKTIELIIESKPWKPNVLDAYGKKPILLRIQYGEIDLGRRVKAAGGRWHKNIKLWELPLQTALDMDLEDRIVDNLSKYRQITKK